MKYITEYNKFNDVNIININELAIIISKKLGYNKANFLKNGTNSVIYDISDNLIMKLTNSDNEALVSEKLNNFNFNFDNIANVYYVGGLNSTKFKIDNNSNSKLRLPYIENIYVIIIEKLFNLEQAYNIIYEIYSILNFELLPNNLLQNVFKFKSKFKKLLLNYNGKYDKDELLHYYETLISINNELKSVNINSYDANCSNFGFKSNGDLAIFDIQDNKFKNKTFKPKFEINLDDLN